MIKCLELSIQSNLTSPKKNVEILLLNDFQIESGKKCVRLLRSKEKEWLAWQVDNEPQKKQKEVKIPLSF
jgi:hypothetical protein